MTSPAAPSTDVPDDTAPDDDRSAEEIIQGELPAIARQLVALAVSGNTTAIALALKLGSPAERPSLREQLADPAFYERSLAALIHRIRSLPDPPLLDLALLLAEIGLPLDSPEIAAQ